MGNKQNNVLKKNIKELKICKCNNYNIYQQKTHLQKDNQDWGKGFRD
jgi:hypothetical protein